MRRHGPVIAHCTDSEDFPKCILLTGSLVFAPHPVNASTSRVRVTGKVGIKVRIRVRFNVMVMVNDSINVMWCINLGDPYSCKFSVSHTSSR